MKLSELKQSGHWPTLLSAFLYFDISFMAWVSLGPLMAYVAKEMHIPIEQKLTLVAIPVLFGAIFRIPLGILADTIGSKLTGTLGQLVVAGACALVWLLGLHSPNQVALFGVILGIGGASFAVALPQAGRWYPPHLQGVVMGIAGAGNLGVVLDTLFAPSIAEHWGWQGVYGVLLIPMVAILAFYLFAAKDAPGSINRVPFSTYGKLLLDPDSRWFMFFYFITFGGFVGLASALPLYFVNQFHTTPVAAGLMVSMIVFFGSTFRPVGGAIADRVGGVKSLSVMFLIVAAAYFAVAFLPVGPAPATGGWSLTELPPVAWLAVLLFSTGALCLGMGNGAVFQLLPQRFRNEVGVMTGLVGFAGGIGGFFLAKALATSKGMTGGFMAGFLFFGCLALLGVAGLTFVKHRWRTTWGAVSGARI
ncbi:MFS transporter [Rhodoblastus acidophilus]|uniref:MFS transporter n=1 Tax=Candidatus Rhodoblastus alkanivorans TaxID=2954117 RepID=A0ABS9Z7V5_9HYPH|nr:MFS transporter [Candidatus Rhodoblastus alkanivorans]MCI4678966.1 MFS transporter [Candidatus Rhodoblastus alkanivorans]MCI4683744.1 MFS transporter [Candidatus Rhodoblastus alkanivorans]MDI4641062.1 MFS transporter [Rhodoblastus acidophilus]